MEQGIIIKHQDRKPRLQPPVLKGIIQQDQVMIILQSFNSSNPVRIHSNRNIAKPGKILVRLITDQGGANFRYGFMACPDKSAARPAVPPDRKSTRPNSSHQCEPLMPSSAC